MTKTFVIAEAGVNHNGSYDLARRLIDVAAEAGADAVKFQTFRAGALVSSHAPKASYQRRTTDASEGQLAMLKRLELGPDEQLRLAEFCVESGIEFLSTPFDFESAEFLTETVGLKRLKISSGDLDNAPFLHRMAGLDVDLILSSGMALMGDIEMALGAVAHSYIGAESPGIETFRRAYTSPEGQAALRERVSLLHCTTEYPADPRDINLRAMETLRAAFGLRTGYSDHSAGIAVSIAAAACGAEIIEKHFTLDRTMPGPDHAASLEPGELRAMVEGVRVVETAVGSTVKIPAPAEEANRAVARKSVTAARSIRKGERFSADNLTLKRPGTGLRPVEWWSLIGSTSARAFEQDELITRD